MDQGSDEFPVYARLTGGSESSELVPMATAVWGFLMLVKERDDADPRQSKALLESGVGLNESDALALRDFVRQAHYMYRDFSTQITDQKCVELDNKPNSNTNVIEALSEIDNLVQSKQSEIVSQIPHVISPSAAKQLLDWVQEYIQPKMKVVTIDHSLATTELGAENVLNRVCGRPPVAGLEGDN